MKVNRFQLLIKFTALYMCFNIVLSVPLSNENENSNDKTSVATAKVDDYDNASVEKTSETSDTKPPLIFPSEDDKTAPKNKTALEILQKSNANTSATIEENDANSETTIKEKEKDKNTTANEETTKEDYDENAPDNNSKKDEKVEEKDDKKEEKEEKDYDEVNENANNDEKDDVENIQETQEQGNLEERYGVNSTTINVFEEPTLKGTHLAFIFASILIFLSVTAYVGLVLWRKNLENRYGMRQRLVTEDDYYNNNDVRFFGL